MLGSSDFIHGLWAGCIIFFLHIIDADKINDWLVIDAMIMPVLIGLWGHGKIDPIPIRCMDYLVTVIANCWPINCFGNKESDVILYWIYCFYSIWTC